MTGTRIRAGIVGLGVGEQHIAGYRAHPAAEVVALCDFDPARRAEASTRYPGLDIYEDARDLLARDDIDVVSVASWDDAHYEQIRLALESGKHVFGEKPLCLHEHEARELATLMRDRPELRVSQNVPLRMSPRFAELRADIAGGAYGELFHLEGDYDYGRRHKLTDGWRGRIDWYSVVLGGAIHLVDLILWLTGDRVVEATAVGNGIATRGTAFRHDDLVVALLQLESGATAKVSANLGCVSPHFHGLRVYGTKATFVNGIPDAIVHRPDRSETVSTAYPGVHKGDLIHSFVEAIVNGGEPLVTETEVFDVLAVCFAIERSRREGRSVAVEPLG